ncbi:sensory box histidine kinase/response regulator [Rhodopseudomonas palustris BisB5]|uniref:histidine kinase n=1 Tax=Rhodopseudomonas palustris (strain BisB5) TaxID=316057 RepID=Q134C8_RHOPS|nr:sensory box histidine kinase/response regulator [Rhodopseudomonas palustris BisB5]
MFDPVRDDAVPSRALRLAELLPRAIGIDTDCIALLDPAGFILEVNPAWSLSGDAGAPESAVGRNWTEIWLAGGRDAAFDAVRRARTGLSSRFTAQGPSANGEPRWFDVIVDPICDADGRFAQILTRARDITIHKNREAELQRRLDEKTAALSVLARQLEAESSDRSAAAARAAHTDRIRLLGQFVIGIIHDFNNVLTVLNGASAMLLRGGLTQQQARILRDINQAISGAAQLSRRLLEFSRLDGTEPEQIALPDFLKTTAAMLSHLMKADIDLVIDVDDACWPVLASPGALRSVVLNLTANAGDAMPNGGSLTITARNCYSTERPPALAVGDYVHLSFSDTGCGMTQAALARAGEAFYTTKSQGRGTGLGLASAFELAGQCGGRVLISSAQGVGTTINIYLPRAGLHGTTAAPSEPKIDRTLHGNATILVIAPDETIRRHLATMLRNLDYRVIVAERDDVALALLASGMKPNLVLFDLQRDQQAGAQLAAQLRQTDSTLPIVFLADSTSAHRLHGELIFRKPVVETQIARAILELLGRLPASIASADALRASDRLRDRIRNPRMRAVYDQWRDLAASLGRLPSPADAEPLTHDLKDDTCLLKIVHGQPSPVFQFVFAGAALVGRLGRELAGELVSASDQNVIASLAGAYQRGLSGLAHFDYARFPLGDDIMVLFERLVLPLSDDGERVSHLAGVITFDEIHNDSERNAQ